VETANFTDLEEAIFSLRSAFFEEAVDGQHPFGDAFGVINAVDAQKHRLVF
jgi:hypothetical protein